MSLSNELPPLDDLQRRIDAAKPPTGTQTDNTASGAAGDALRFSVELLSGLAVGAFIGYFLDRWLGTFPWLFIIFFFLGAIAGFRNLLREAHKDENT